MSAADRIARYLKLIRYVQALPERLQLQVLEYVQTLLARNDQADETERGWTEGALAQAMRGMEREDEPEYSRADLKESFS